MICFIRRACVDVLLTLNNFIELREEMAYDHVEVHRREFSNLHLL